MSAIITSVLFLCVVIVCVIVAKRSRNTRHQQNLEEYVKLQAQAEQAPSESLKTDGSI